VKESAPKRQVTARKVRRSAPRGGVFAHKVRESAPKRQVSAPKANVPALKEQTKLSSDIMEFLHLILYKNTEPVHSIK